MMYALNNIPTLLLSCAPIMVILCLNPTKIFFLKEKLEQIYDFLLFCHEYNPTLVFEHDIIYEEPEFINKLPSDPIPVINKSPPQPEKYEDKYLKSFKNIQDSFSWTADELSLKITQFNILQRNSDAKHQANIDELKSRQLLYKDIQADPTGVKLMNYFDEDEPLTEEELTKYNMMIIDDQEECLKEIEKINNTPLTSVESLQKEADEYVTNIKCDKLINNYIIESTPMGNVFMRYNNNKKTFEYFSNHTIPYRFLEVVGRKYVITYFCRPLFVDIEEELKRAEIIYDEKKLKQASLGNKPAQHQMNAQSKLLSTIQNGPKNRTVTTLPPQVKPNLPNVKTNDKHLIKENSNRYTHEGRLSDFCPLKKTDKKVVDKNLNLTFADFKRLQANK